MSKLQYFYILKNDSLSQDWVKVMTSDKALSNTSEELTKTELPTPFTIVAGLRAPDVSAVQHYFAQPIHITANFKFGTTKDFINISSSVANKYLVEASLFLEDCEIVDVNGINVDDLVAELDLVEEEVAVVEPKTARVATKAAARAEAKAAKAAARAEAKAAKDAARAEAKAARAAAKAAKAAKTPNPNRLPAFRFTLIGLKPGDDIIFAPLNLKVRIVDEQHVKYKGNEYSTSLFCKTFIPDEMRKSCNTYRGPDYFTYKGKTLTEIRREMGV